MRKFLFTFIIITNFVKAQNKEIDSLLTLISKAKNDSLKVEYYIQICQVCDIKYNLKFGTAGLNLVEKIENKKSKTPSKNYLLKQKLFFFDILNLYYWSFKRDYFEAIQIIEKEILIEKKLKDTVQVENNIVRLTHLYEYLGNLPRRLDTLFSRLKYYENIHNYKFICKYESEISDVYRDIGNYNKELEYKKKSLKSAKKSNNKLSEARVCRDIAHTYSRYSLYDSALLYNRRYLNLLKINNANEDEFSIAYYTYTEIYKQLKKYDSAFYYSEKAIQSSMLSGSQNYVSSSYRLKASIYEDLKNYAKAKEYTFISLKELPLGNYEGRFIIYLTLSKYTTSEQKYKEAIEYCNKAYKIADSIKDSELLIQVFENKYGIYLKMNDYKNALDNHLKYLTVKNTLDIQKNKVKIEQADIRRLFEKKEIIKKEEQAKKDQIANKEKQQQQIILLFVLGGLVLVVGFAVMIFNRFKVTQKQNKIIILQKAEVEKQKENVETQKHLVEEKQKEITDSITYAKRLQQAILPPTEFITQFVPQNFVLYKPKDIVAGDFYWAEQINHLFFIAAADCTGHGVPGAMVSLVCSSALNRSVKEFTLTDTGKILDKTRELVIETFEKSNADIKDGMDISLLCIDMRNQKIYWTGANNPLWYIQDNTLIEIKADKQPVGKSYNAEPFTTNSIDYKTDTTFYLFTDGLADQFGGPKGKKFKYKQFEELLTSINKHPMTEQVKIIDRKFEEWKGELEQIDDVCVIGLRILNAL